MSKYFVKIHFRTDSDDQAYITCKSVSLNQENIIISGMIIDNQVIGGLLNIPLSIVATVSVARKEVEENG